MATKKKKAPRPELKPKKPKRPKQDEETKRALKNLGEPTNEELDAQEQAKDREEEQAQDQPHINRKKFHKVIHVMLEGEERAKVQEEHLAACNEVEQRENTKAAVMKEHNEDIKAAQERADVLRNKLNKGTEETVHVEEFKDFDAGIYRLSRVDNGKVLETRDLDEKDRQPELNVAVEESPASAAEPDADAIGEDMAEALAKGEASTSEAAFSQASADADRVDLEQRRKVAYDEVLERGGSLDDAEAAANAITEETRH